MERSSATTSIVEMPYATKLLGDELQTYLNMGMRILTAKGVAHLEQDVFTLPEGDMVRQALEKPLPQAILVDTRVPKYDESAPPVKVEDAEEDLFALGHIEPESEAAEPPEEIQESAMPQAMTSEAMTSEAMTSEAMTPEDGTEYAPPQQVPQQFAPMLTLQQPVYLSQPVFPSGMNSPVYAPNTPVPAQQTVAGVPQTVQSGGFQMVQEPFSSRNTIVIDGGPMDRAPPMQQRGGSQRNTRRMSHAPQSMPQASAPTGRITIRKIG
jgi:hypothetical protein